MYFGEPYGLKNVVRNRQLPHEITNHIVEWKHSKFLTDRVIVAGDFNMTPEELQECFVSIKMYYK